MAKRSFEAHTYAMTATADGSALANNTYQALEAGSSTQYVEVQEVYIGGQAASSAVNIAMLARNGTVGTTPTALSNATAVDGPMRSFTAALAAPPVTYVAAGTGPQRASNNTHARLNLTHNAFGGIVRWVAAPGEEYGILGNAAGAGVSLSAFTGGGGGTVGSHLIYEPW